MLNYLLSSLVYYWDLFEINSGADILAVGAVPSLVFLIATILIAKIIHMHVNRDSIAVKTGLKRMRKDIALYNEFLTYQGENDRLEERAKERRDNISDAYTAYTGTGDNLLRSKIARYKAANDELKQRYRE